MLKYFFFYADQYISFLLILYWNAWQYIFVLQAFQNTHHFIPNVLAMAQFADEPHSLFYDDVCFYDDAPAPSDEIWKKFELLPTPPRSPQRDKPTLGQSLAETCGGESFLTHTCTIINESVCVVCDGNLKSKLIQDIMWSPGTEYHLGTSKTCKAPKKSDSTNDTTVVLKKKTTGLISVEVNNGGKTTHVEIPTSECVDPVEVFPFPVSKAYHGGKKLCTDTPSDTGKLLSSMLYCRAAFKMVVQSKFQVVRSNLIFPHLSSNENFVNFDSHQPVKCPSNLFNRKKDIRPLR